MNRIVRSALTQMWALPPPFESPAQEQAFLQDFCRRFAVQRRLAAVLGFFAILAYLASDYHYSAGDPEFSARLEGVLWNRVATALQLVPFFALTLRRRFEQDERYANAVLVSGSFINFLFHCSGFLLAPYPFDYMYFFMGMFIAVIFGFAMLRVRARGVLVLMGLCLAASAVTFAWNWQLKQSQLDSHAARIYQWAAFDFLITIAVIGYVVANLLEKTARASFVHAAKLAQSNDMLRARNDEVARLNLAMHGAVARAERESTARTRVLASASHDLRQPLHALSIYSAILATHPAPHTMTEASVNINHIVQSLGELLHGLLDLSHLSSGDYVPVRQRVVLDQLLVGVLSEFEPAARAKGLCLRRQIAPATLMGDPVIVARIARNLLDNALKYTERGSVTLQLACEGDEAVLRVVDTGRGIAPAEQQRIFEEFYQVDNPGRDRGRGVGLGLAIVQRLVALVDGRMALESVPGEGTRFEVRLPGAAGRSASTAARPDGLPMPAPASPQARRTVYVVDDEAEILRSTGVLLDMWHFQVRTANGASEAEALFRQHGVPDLLMIDLRLRGPEHGAALAARLRALHGPFEVLIVTGETSAEALREAGDAGWRVLHKPLGAPMLWEAIESALAGQQAAATPP